MNRLWTWCLFASLLLAGWALPAQADEAWELRIDGAIGPATTDYITRALEEAEEAGAAFVLLRMDTPGGLDAATRDIIKAILASNVPVVTWVTPKGARAASAGTYILYASHVAAMSPATNLGSATPVQMGAPGMPGPQQPPADGDSAAEDGGDAATDGAAPADESVPAPGTAMERKVLNDAVAYIRGLAELRGRNADWAEKAVREAANLSAADALEQNVIDLVAEDRADLLAQLDGRTVTVNEREVTLNTEGLTVVEREPDWRNQFLATITNPNVAYILMLIGIYGLILEFYNPGGFVPGVVGAICLLLALYAMQVLPVSYVGLGLIILGVALMIGEAMVPSFGILGFGGVVAFVIGSIVLMDTELPAFQIAMPIILALAVTSVGVLVLIVRMALRAHAQRQVTGLDQLVGAMAIPLTDFSGDGQVQVGGEIWHAHTEDPVQKGQSLWISRVDGLTVHLTDQKPPTEN